MKHDDVLTLRPSENFRQPLDRSDNLIKVTKYSFLLRLTSKKNSAMSSRLYLSHRGSLNRPQMPRQHTFSGDLRATGGF